MLLQEVTLAVKIDSEPAQQTCIGVRNGHIHNHSIFVKGWHFPHPHRPLLDADRQKPQKFSCCLLVLLLDILPTLGEMACHSLLDPILVGLLCLIPLVSALSNLDESEPILRRSPASPDSKEDWFGFSVVLHQVEDPEIGNIGSFLDRTRYMEFVS